jgi:protein involved in ribonucleotide reduction
MLVVFDSLTGNTKRFVDKLQLNSIKIHEGLVITDPYILITYTTGFGNAPKSTLEFLKSNHEHLKGVAASGNKNWGNNYAMSADVVANTYNVPILLKFELSGTKQDVRLFMQEVTNVKMD